MTMLSMDGPNTNWNVLENMKKVEMRMNYHNYLMWVVVASMLSTERFILELMQLAVGSWKK